MGYELHITSSCEKRLKKLNQELQNHFFKKVERLRDNPIAYGKPLRQNLSGYWELYFEKSYRILYTIDVLKKEVTLMAIKHKDEF